jgi:uncharacterized damage-inducible protein DinB
MLGMVPGFWAEVSIGDQFTTQLRREFRFLGVEPLVGILCAGDNESYRTIRPRIQIEGDVMNIPLMKNRACLALAEETETARQALYKLVPRFPRETLAAGDPKKEDNVRGILCHVVLAGHSYGCWIRRVLGRLDPDQEKADKKAFRDRVFAITTAEGFDETSRWAIESYYAAMAECSEEDLNREFKTNWGDTLGVEMMMEHALVHLLRHRRQLEIFLGDRERGKTAGEA